MYLDGGQVPARYQIQRYKLNFLQYILQQKETSILFTMLEAQKKQPVRGDWFSECIKILQSFDINISLQDINDMTRKQFRRITKDKCEQTAFIELIKKKDKGSKGATLIYGKRLQMADYLCPNIHLSVEEQRQIFQIRSKINPLPSNRGVTVFCVTGCGEMLDNSHILQCKVLNPKEQKSIEDLINGDIITMKRTLFEWNRRITKMEELSAQDPEL